MSIASIQPFLILPLVYFTRGIDFSAGSSNLLWLRTAFGAVQVLTVVALLLIRQRIEAAKATTSAKEIKGAREVCAPSRAVHSPSFRQ